jgi:CubicO group peptidase (beta-lactamase class C family)
MAPEPSPAWLEPIIRQICTTLERDPRYAHTTNVVLIHRGEIVLARHFGAGAVTDLTDIYSVTKSVVGTLAGIAIDDRVLQLEDVRDLLTMTAGRETGGPWDIDAVMERDGAWVEWILSAPQRHEPGAAFVYDNGAAHVLAAKIADAVGEPLEEFARRRLFEPLEITQWFWPRDPDGLAYGFGHLQLSPLDLGKLGGLYLNEGEYRGRRIVSREFTAAATRAWTAGGPPEEVGYGYFWWSSSEPFPQYFAGGYAGQSVTVVPHLELVAVTTGEERRLQPGWRNARHAVLGALPPRR